MNIPQLTITRFLAAMAIVFFHFARGVPPFNSDPWRLFPLLGPTALCYFIILSGFVMAIVYARPAAGSLNLKRYWRARLARSVPVYFIVLIALIPFKLGEPAFAAAGVAHDVPGLIVHFLLLQSVVHQYALVYNYPCWALSTLMVLYLVFPFLISYLKARPMRSLIGISLVVWVVSQIANTYLIETVMPPPASGWHNFIYYSPLFHFSSFLLGCVAGLWFLDHGKALGDRKGLNTALFVSSIVLIAALLLFRLDLYQNGTINLSMLNGLPAPLLVLFMVTLSADKTALRRSMINRALVLLGRAAFSIYILHFPVDTFYKNLVKPRVHLSTEVHFWIYIAVLMVAGVIALKFVEEPARKWLRGRQAAL
jgi:peptidoglycan/LPS O-acetylase OafA/YrhL